MTFSIEYSHYHKDTVWDRKAYGFILWVLNTFFIIRLLLKKSRAEVKTQTVLFLERQMTLVLHIFAQSKHPLYHPHSSHTPCCMQATGTHRCHKIVFRLRPSSMYVSVKLSRASQSVQSTGLLCGWESFAELQTCPVVESCPFRFFISFFSCFILSLFLFFSPSNSS